MRRTKKAISLLLTLAMVLTMIPAISLVFTEKAKAYSSYSKPYSTEYYYASGTKFIYQLILYYSSSSNGAASDWLSNNGWTDWSGNFNAGDGSSSKYVHSGYKTTTDPTVAIKGILIADGHPTSVSYGGCTYYAVGSGSITQTPTGGDGMVDLNKGNGGDDLYLMATADRAAGPALTALTKSQSGNSGTAQNNLTNNGYRIVTDQSGNYQDTNAGAGGDYNYCGQKSSCTTVNSDDLRAAYLSAKNRYENGGSGISGLSTALNTASNILSDLNDGYTTYTQAQINAATQALNYAVATVSVNTATTFTVSSANTGAYGLYAFTPSSSGKYVFLSNASVDTKGWIYTKDTSSSIGLTQITNGYNDDVGSGSDQYTILGLNHYYNHYVKDVTLNAGTTYYLRTQYYSSQAGNYPIYICNAVDLNFYAADNATAVKSYTNFPASFSLNLGHTKIKDLFTRSGHTQLGWASSKINTNEERNYTTTQTITIPTSTTNFAALWSPSSPTVVNANTAYTAAVSTAYTIQYYKFTPSTTRKYKFYGTASGLDTYGVMYEPSAWANNATILTYDDDAAGNQQFAITRQLTANTAYLLGVKCYGSNTGSVPFRIDAIYNITYNANGGSGAPSAQEKQYGVALTLSSTQPTRNGYTFRGWATSSSATSAAYAAGGSYTGNADLALYAVWEANQYGIAFNVDGGATVNDMAYKTNENKTLPSTTKAGYTLSGWKVTTADGSWTSGATFAAGTSVNGKYGNPTLTAQWTGVPFKVHFDGNGATSGSMSDQSFVYGTAQNLTANAFSRSHTITYNYNYSGSTNGSDTVNSTFAGWATSASGNVAYANQANGSTLTTTANATVNLFAKWNLGSVTLPTPTRAGYVFGGWYTNEACTEGYKAGGSSFTPTANTTLYAKWAGNSYSVTFNGNGSTSGSMTAQSFIYGTAQNLKDNAFKREFTVTYVGNGGTPTKTGDTATATFNGWATSATGSKVYNDKQSVTDLTATAGGTFPLFANWTDASVTLPSATRTGYTLKGWYTAATGGSKYGDANASYTPTADVTMTAQWTPVEYTMILDVDGTQTVDTYTIESEVVLPEESKTGHSFQGWKVTANEGNWTETTNLAAGTAPAGRYGNVTLTAQWEAETYEFTIRMDQGPATADLPLSVAYDGTYTFTVTLDAAHNQKTPAITAENADVAQTREGDTITVTISNVTGPVTVNVPIELNNYTLTIEGDEGFSIGDSVTTATHGSAFSFTVTLSDGYTQNAPTVTMDGTPLAVKSQDGNAYSYEIENVTADVNVSVTATKNTYNVTFSSDDGADAPADATIYHGENCSFSVTPKTGYTQTAPAVTVNNETLAAASVVDGTYNYVIEAVKETKAVVITTTINTYDVTFTADDGAEVPATKTVDHNADCEFTVTLKTGYTQTAPTVTVDGEPLEALGNENGVYSYKITGVTTDKAVAVATAINTYNVTFTADDGADAPAAQTIDHGATCTFTVTLKTGYTQTAPAVTVGSETLEATGSNGNAYTYQIAGVTADKAVAISTTLNSYDVTFTADDGATAPEAQTVSHGADASFTVTLKEGYTQTAPTVTVNGVDLEADSVEDNTYSYVIANVTGDKEVAIATAINTYDVTFTADDGADAPAAQTIDHGEDCTFTVTLKTGYTQTAPVVTVGSETLTGATEDDLTFTYVIENVTADKAVAISTTLNSYDVTFTSDDGADAPAAQTITHGQDCTFTVTLKTGYTQSAPVVTVGSETLTGTTEDNLTFTYVIENVTADKTVAISTTLNSYDVTFTADDGADAPAAQTIDHGEDCTFTVTLNTGYTQTAPAVTVNGDALAYNSKDGDTYTFVIADVTEAKAVAIATVINTYDVTFTSDDGADAPAAQTIDHGQNCTFTVTLKEGYTQTAPVVTVDGEAITGTTKDDLTFTYVIENVTAEKAVSISTTLNTYTITWKNYDGELLATDTVAHGNMPAYEGDDPVKESTAEHSYAFEGVWYPVVVEAEADAEYIAQFTETVRTYNVTFVNEDGTVLKTKAYDYGTPAADIELPDDPTKDATAQYTYTFKGWDKDIADVTGDVVYTATYTSTVNSYSVKFFNYDETLLDSQTLDYGELPVYAGDDPEKPADAQYTYTFAGWTPTVATVTDAAEYVARYDETVNAYTVKFVNGDTVLQEETLDYGTMPEYKGAEPSMEATAEFTYQFTGWDKPIATVTDAETYIAMFNNITNSYEVKFVNYNDEVLQEETLDYGTLPEYKGTTPVRPADAQYTYTFDGWDKTIGLVTGEVVYKATYSYTVNTYTITWMDEDGSELDSQVLAYGATPVYGGADPTKDFDAEQHYAFAGWGDVTEVTGPATYTAVYTGEAHVWNDGTVSIAPTCAALGRKDFVCTVCDATKMETIEKDPTNHVGGTEVRGRIEPTEETDGYSGDIYCRSCDELLQQGTTLRNLKGYCPYCGEYHEGLLGMVITAIHGIVWLFHKAFRLIP